MSLEHFFIMPTKKDARKKNSKWAADEAWANPEDNTEPELEQPASPARHSTTAWLGRVSAEKSNGETPELWEPLSTTKCQNYWTEGRHWRQESTCVFWEVDSRDLGHGHGPPAVRAPARSWWGFTTTRMDRGFYAKQETRGGLRWMVKQCLFIRTFLWLLWNEGKNLQMRTEGIREVGIKYAFVYPTVIKILPWNGKPISLSTMKDYVKTLSTTRWPGVSIHLQSSKWYQLPQKQLLKWINYYLHNGQWVLYHIWITYVHLKVNHKLRKLLT